jgi:putative sterol carrier protein
VRVTKWMSPEWFDRVLALAPRLPGRPGLSARIQQQITAGPEGDVSCYWVVEDGRPTAAAAGTTEPVDLTLTLAWADAAALQAGSLDASVAFMQGRMKVAGSMERALALLPATRSPEAEDLCRRIGEFTDW